MSEYRSMTPELMYLYDEAFTRNYAEDSMKDSPMFTVYSELSAMNVIHRSTMRNQDNPALSLVDAMKIYLSEGEN